MRMPYYILHIYDIISTKHFTPPRHAAADAMPVPPHEARARGHDACAMRLFSAACACARLLMRVFSDDYSSIIICPQPRYFDYFAHTFCLMLSLS